MSSLREVKDRIASVRSTLKITSAMKLVASSKLRRAQSAIEGLRPYQEALSSILAAAGAAPLRDASAGAADPAIPSSAISHSSSSAATKSMTEGPDVSRGSISGETGVFPAAKSMTEGPDVSRGSISGETGVFPATKSMTEGPDVSRGASASVFPSERTESRKLLLLAFASNSSMCGAFNANAVKKALELVGEYETAGWSVECWAFGRKMAEGLRKGGARVARDFSSLVGRASFDDVAAVTAEVRGLFESGAVSAVVLVYNHFVSTGRQQLVEEDYLSRLSYPGAQSTDIQQDAVFACTEKHAGKSHNELSYSELSASNGDESAFIIEPSRAELVETLLPQVLNLKLYSALLDSAAAEHAARMVAMQAATDNATELLSALTLEYNKGRQQKITSEILDLVGAEA